MEHIRRTIQIGQREHLIFTTLRPNSKNPPFIFGRAVKGWQLSNNWIYPDRQLEYLYAKDKYNIAVIANEHFIFDCDDGRSIEKLRELNTLVTLTPHGAHVYFNGDFDKCCIYAESIGLNVDTVRRNMMYALCAPSVIDGKGYHWLDYGKTSIRSIPEAG